MITLNEGQNKALRSIEHFLRSSDTRMCFNAPSGYGKTTTLNALKSNLESINKKNRLMNANASPFNEVILTATTTKAASLIPSAKTIHKTLGLYVWKDFSTGQSNIKERAIGLPENCIVVIDESSMIDHQLYGFVYKHINNYKNVKYIFTGDEAQLKSVSSNFSVFELGLPSVSLLEPVRQEADSTLFAACIALRSAVFGSSPNIAVAPDIRKIEKAELHTYLTTQDLSDTKIITFTNKQAIKYNQLIRLLHDKPLSWAVGDYIVTRSFYEPAPIPLESMLKIVDISTVREFQGVNCNRMTFHNGEKANVAVNPADIVEAKKLAKAARNWGRVKKLEEHILDIRDAGAGTVHTTQGSSYDTVIVDLKDISKCFNKDMKNRLHYTAISRARKQVFLIC